MTAVSHQNLPARIGPVAAIRLAIGLLQGALLYWLFRSTELAQWPATDPVALDGLLIPAVFVPLILIHGTTQLPRRWLLSWAAAAALMGSGLGMYDAYRVAATDEDFLWASFPFVPFLGVGLFIAHALILAAHDQRRLIPTYPTYFDALSKHAVQFAASTAFVGVLWLVLLLGAALFKLIGLDFLRDLLQKPWFAFPATTLALAAALHMTDLGAGLIRGMRTLALTLLSWLLPLLTLLVAGFLVSLPFTGLQELWDTKIATALLLAASAALIVLINTTYPDGESEQGGNAFLRHSARLAALLPAPMVVIATYALALRVGQYGWTEDRVLALAAIIVAAFFAGGYVWAALRPSAWLKRLGVCNVAASFVVLAVLFGLTSPIADPARIAVASQIARLHGGGVLPEQFDFGYLRFSAGRYGIAALERMKSGEINITGVRERAERALASREGNIPPLADELAANIKLASRTLPPSFIRQNWLEATNGSEGDYPECLYRQSETCEAFLIDLDADGTDEILLTYHSPGRGPAVFKMAGDGSWKKAGAMPARLACEDLRILLRAGDVRVIVSPWRDLEVDGQRMEMSENGFDRTACPTVTP